MPAPQNKSTAPEGDQQTLASTAKRPSDFERQVEELVKQDGITPAAAAARLRSEQLRQEGQQEGATQAAPALRAQGSGSDRAESGGVEKSSVERSVDTGG